MTDNMPLTKIAIDELKEAIKVENDNKKEAVEKIDALISKIKEAL